MKYLLDTTVLSDFVRGHAAVRYRWLRAAPAELAVSAITVMEVEYGLALNPDRALRIRPVVDGLLQLITVVPCGDTEARTIGRLRGALARVGTPIGPWDAVIAGTALAHGLIMVTSNTAEFRRITRLRLQDWREAGVHEGDAEPAEKPSLAKVIEGWGDVGLDLEAPPDPPPEDVDL